MQNAPVFTGSSLIGGIDGELKCKHCGWPLIKNGELKCSRSGHTVQATLGQKRIFCPFCRKPRVTLVKNDQVICPQCKQQTAITGGIEVKSKNTVADSQLPVVSKKAQLREYLGKHLRDAFDNAMFLSDCLEKGSRIRYEGLSSDTAAALKAKDSERLRANKQRYDCLKSISDFVSGLPEIEDLEKFLGADIQVICEITELESTKAGSMLDIRRVGLSWTKTQGSVTKEFWFGLGGERCLFITERATDDPSNIVGKYRFFGVCYVMLDVNLRVSFWVSKRGHVYISQNHISVDIS